MILTWTVNGSRCAWTGIRNTITGELLPVTLSAVPRFIARFRKFGPEGVRFTMVMANGESVEWDDGRTRVQGDG